MATAGLAGRGANSSCQVENGANRYKEERANQLYLFGGSGKFGLASRTFLTWSEEFLDLVQGNFGLGTREILTWLKEDLGLDWVSFGLGKNLVCLHRSDFTSLR